MSNILKYKGYTAKIEYSVKDKILYGKIEGISDLVSFESDNATEIEKEFHTAVEEYLLFCTEHNKNPEKSYTGTFNVRIAPELHKELASKAIEKDISLNCAVEQAIEQYITNENFLEKLFIKSRVFAQAATYSTLAPRSSAISHF